MTTTTVLSEDTATIVRDDAGRFNWGAAIAGAVVAAAVTFFLATLGDGIGLALISVPNAMAPGFKTFLSLGAIYFFAAQAFGFAAGGHIAGRLIGPAIENAKEEEFRAGAHGLVAWGLAVIAGLAILALTATIGSSVTGATTMNSTANTAVSASYWTDMLFRPATENISPTLANDKSEATRILGVDLARGSNTSSENREELARLAWQDAGLSRNGARERVNVVEAQMQGDAVHAAENARKTASYAGIWTALALLFGAIVSVAAAISARWEDDRLSFSMTRRC